MKVWKLVVATEYLGSQVLACGYKEMEAPEGVEIGKNYYDKMGNQQANFVYIDDIKKVDELFFSMYRKLKERYGLARMPEHARDYYEQSYNRAIENHPEVIL